MTDQLLRDLLHERVADVTTGDMSAAAWRDGRRTRGRNRVAVVGVVAVASAAVSMGVAVLGDGDPVQPAPAPALPTPTAPAVTEPDATYEGVRVFWSPDQIEERDLPRVGSDALPSNIDLTSGPMVKAMDRAVAAFAVGERVHLVDQRGGQVTVGVGRLDDVIKPNGYAYRPVHDSMLSPGGRYLVFPQVGSVAVYSLEDGWSEIDTGDRVTRFVTWVDDERFILPPAPGQFGDVFDVGTGSTVESEVTLQLRSEVFRPAFDTSDVQAYGPTKRSPRDSVAQTRGMGLPVPVEHAGKYVSDPEFVATRVRGETSLLSIMGTIGDGTDSRYLQCCPVAGWLDDDVLVYESRQAEPALVAWTVGTREFRLVSRIDGRYDVASFARLS